MTTKLEAAISCKESYFKINGKSRLVISGELSYFKTDPIEWEDRIRKLKASLLNCISTYVPWGLHESEKEQFSFSGRLDIAEFVELMKQNQLFGILKPSGYVCDEISGGGFPSWIWAEGVRTRTGDPAFLDYLHRWLDTITPLLKDTQITEGGNVILWQVENEFGFGNKPYLFQLANRVKELGIEVPIVLNNGDYYAEEGLLGAFDYYPTPAPDQIREVAAYFQNYRATHPDKPIFSQEFEAGWLNTALSSDVTTMGHLPRVWLESLSKLAFINGCAGLNYFMFAGGTDPGMQPAKFFPNRYYNEAAIEEWGELGELYYRYKTTHAQLLSFESLLVEEPEIMTGSEACVEGVPSEVLVNLRGKQLLAFSNASDEIQAFTWESELLGLVPTLTVLQPMETKIYPLHVLLHAGLKWMHSSAEILYRDAGVCIVFGEIGQENQLKLVWNSEFLPHVVDSGAVQTEWRANELTITFTPQREDQWICLDAYRIMMVSRERAMHTWFGPEVGGKRDLLISDLYYADWSDSDDGHIQVEAELGVTHALTVIRSADASMKQMTYTAPDAIAADLQETAEIMKWDICQDWEKSFVSSEAAAKKTKLGSSFEANGHNDCGYAVYTSEWISDGEEQQLLIPEVNDYFDLFINEEWIASGQRTMKLRLNNLIAGKNSLMLRCYSTGHDKDMALDPALSGMMLPLYVGALHYEELVSWQQKMLFTKEEKDAMFEDKDLLLSYHDNGYAQAIGIDIGGLGKETGNWSSFEFGSEGVLIKDANIDYTGSGEVLNRTQFYADAKYAGSRVLLEVRDADLIYALYVNGKHLAAIWQGWSNWGFENSPKYWDITSLIQFGESNQILLRCLMGPRGGGVLQPASVSFYKTAIEGEANFTPLASGIQAAIEGELGTYEQGSLKGLIARQEGSLIISRSQFAYTEWADLVHPMYIELEGVQDFTLIYVNGELIGKYYPGGYQRRFYVWRSWLKEGDNELALVGKLTSSPQPCIKIGCYHVKMKDRIVLN
ncbi:beta-galactosidase [Paenibacillus sp. CF384]|uniref:beta-galactosidase n=1 Tax=Paenibacillus sp. CF384 TaxID=1884382 RepID=UPI00089D01D4|nr:beta-galactosidase [Paenibacillus sp. CF384]SDX07309.1 Glycosyl hydrolases family 35 [Paenibacillus sp. CF384]